MTALKYLKPCPLEEPLPCFTFETYRRDVKENVATNLCYNMIRGRESMLPPACVLLGDIIHREQGLNMVTTASPHRHHSGLRDSGCPRAHVPVKGPVHTPSETRIWMQAVFSGVHPLLLLEGF